MKYTMHIKINFGSRSKSAANAVASVLPDAEKINELFGNSIPAVLPIKWRLDIAGPLVTSATLGIDEALIQ